MVPPLRTPENPRRRGALIIWVEAAFGRAAGNTRAGRPTERPVAEQDKDQGLRCGDRAGKEEEP